MITFAAATAAHHQEQAIRLRAIYGDAMIVRAAEPVAMTVAQVADAFATWMREMGFAGREYPSAQLVSFYDWFCEDINLWPVSRDLVVHRLANLPGVVRRRVRTADTENASGKETLYLVQERAQPRQLERRPSREKKARKAA